MTSITVFCKNGADYKKYVFNKTTVHFSKGVEVNDDGYTKSDKCIIRIFKEDGADIFPEDKVEIGLGGDYPSKDALTVVCVTNNMCGTHPHLKIECV